MFRDFTELPTHSVRWNNDKHSLEQMIEIIQHHNTSERKVGVYRKWRKVMVDGLPIIKKIMAYKWSTT